MRPPPLTRSYILFYCHQLSIKLQRVQLSLSRAPISIVPHVITFPFAICNPV